MSYVSYLKLRAAMALLKQDAEGVVKMIDLLEGILEAQDRDMASFESHENTGHREMVEDMSGWTRAKPAGGFSILDRRQFRYATWRTGAIELLTKRVMIAQQHLRVLNESFDKLRRIYRGDRGVSLPLKY